MLIFIKDEGLICRLKKESLQSIRKGQKHNRNVQSKQAIPRRNANGYHLKRGSPTLVKGNMKIETLISH